MNVMIITNQHKNPAYGTVTFNKNRNLSLRRKIKAMHADTTKHHNVSHNRIIYNETAVR